VLIVDDEPLARRGVLARLRKVSDVQVVGECANGPAAVEAILVLAPDIVFLDVQMPGMDGFEVLRAVPKDRLPQIVFLTAYEQYAVRAFECHAVDYLLKPVDDVRFQDAVERVRSQTVGKTRAVERLVKLLEERTDNGLARFMVRIGPRLVVVPAQDIEWVAAAGDYAELHTGYGSYLLRETMNSLERKLERAGFIRIHRSRIVRSACIRELRPVENGEFVVKLADRSEHRSSRTYAPRLDEWLSAGDARSE
jgi:two-component system, LytTR family, response regulator